MVKVIGGQVVCSNCHTLTTKEAGYWLCPACNWRFYGDPNTKAYNDGCINCGTVYLKCQRFCPCCGLSANDL